MKLTTMPSLRKNHSSNSQSTSRANLVSVTSNLVLDVKILPRLAEQFGDLILHINVALVNGHTELLSVQMGVQSEMEHVHEIRYQTPHGRNFAVALLHKHRFVHETCRKTFNGDEQMQGGDDSYDLY